MPTRSRLVPLREGGRRNMRSEVSLRRGEKQYEGPGRRQECEGKDLKKVTGKAARKYK
jgi:hypothetical protein